MGIGKTRLLTEVSQQAKTRGFALLAMHAYESSTTFPYFPFIEALRPILRTTTNELHFYFGASSNLTLLHEGGKLSLASTSLVSALACLFPELPARMHIQPPSEILSPEQEKFRLFDAIATVIEQLSNKNPLLVCLDNVQWFDSASLELLLYLITRLRTSRVALIGASRPAQTIHEQDDQREAQKVAEITRRVLAQFIQQDMWFPLPLTRLSDEALTEHLQHLLPGGLLTNIATPLLTRSDGNPFFLEELVRGLTLNQQFVLRNGVWYLKQNAHIKLPTSITTAIEQRLASLSPACLDILSIAALFGRSFPVDALTQVALQVQGNNSNEGDIQKLLNEATRASLLAREAEDASEDALDRANMDPHIVLSRYTFCQNVVQEVLHAGIALQRAHRLHLMIGQALEQSYAYEAPKHAAELAAHYAAGNDKQATLRWSIAAGEQAIRQQAHRQAIKHFRLALILLEAGTEIVNESAMFPTPAQLHLSIGELWFKLGELDVAAQSFQQALELLNQEEDNSPLLRVRINRGLADIYRMQAKYEQALAHLRVAREIIEGQEPTAMMQEREHSTPWFFKQTSSATAVLPPERIGTAEYVLYLQARAMLNLLLNRSQEAEEDLWKAHKLATTLGDRGSQAFSLHLIGWICGWGERIYEAIRLQKQSHELYLALGDPFRATLGAQGLGSIYQALGETETAAFYTQRGLVLARQYGVRGVLGWLQRNEATLALQQGNWESSESYLAQALQSAEIENNTRLKPAIVQAQAILQFRRGLWSKAEQLYQQAIELAKNTDWLASTVALYGHFLAVTGRRTTARTYLDRARSLPEYAGFSGTFYIPFLVEGYLHLDMSELAAPYLERVKKLRRFMYYGYSVSRILGELAIATRNWEQAQQAFEEGLQLCRRTNNQPEEAAILYEQARMDVMRGESLQTIQPLCEQAQTLFLQYEMKRAATLVDTLLEGVQTLNGAENKQKQPRTVKGQTISVTTAEHVLHLKLSAREREVLLLVAEGHTDREIADILVLSHRTIHRHLSNIFVKLDVPGRAAAVAYAIRQELV